MISAKLKAAYNSTTYRVNDLNLNIKVNQESEELRQLLIDNNAEQWAFITACNPHSQVLSDEENNQRQNELKELLIANKYQIYEGLGVGEDESWEAEESFLIFGISQKEAELMGKKFHQNAILFGELSSLPSLIYLINEKE